MPVLGAEDRATADWTLGHIALSDGMLAAVARDVLAGRPPVSTTPAMEPAALARLTATHRSLSYAVMPVNCWAWWRPSPRTRRRL
ncbi:hypothetical protein [Streptomyces albireticuli]|uniref:hypothetical protein n=1 Tax=Streptomyces albireticuli TaxID=1940 RepID=UPI001331AF1B|nr:hypothetical protein [Streptomyces albireticuli]